MRIIKTVELIIIVLFLLSCGVAGLFYFIDSHTRRLRKGYGRYIAQFQQG